MKNVLVTYASKRGSTTEIAEAIADTLRRSGLSVECRKAGDVAGIAPYDAVVLGSAVYMKRWRGDAKRFLHKHSDELLQHPLWVFSSGPVGDPAKGGADSSWNEPPRIVKQVEQLGAREHIVFGGRVPTQPRGPIERAMVKGTPPEHRDNRDWDAIRAWAEAIAAELHAAPAAA